MISICWFVLPLFLGHQYNELLRIELQEGRAKCRPGQAVPLIPGRKPQKIAGVYTTDCLQWIIWRPANLPESSKPFPFFGQVSHRIGRASKGPTLGAVMGNSPGVRRFAWQDPKPAPAAGRELPFALTHPVNFDPDSATCLSTGTRLALPYDWTRQGLAELIIKL